LRWHPQWGKGGYGGKPWKVSLCSWGGSPSLQASGAPYASTARSTGISFRKNAAIGSYDALLMRAA